MSATFTDDDREKTVENANGEVVGTVTSIEDDTVQVKPRAGIVDSIRATLGWSGSKGETMMIHEETVDEISSETIRLEAESIEEIDASAESESASVDETAGEGTPLDEPERPLSDTDSDGEADATLPSDIELDEPADATPMPDIEPDNAAERGPETDLDDERMASNRADEVDEPASGNAAERGEDPTVPDGIEEMETPPNAEADDETAEIADDNAEMEGMMGETGEMGEGLEGDEATEDGVDTDDPINVGGETARAAEADVTDDLSEQSDEPSAESESDAAPDAMSGTQSEDSDETMDRAGVQDVPMGDSGEPTADSTEETPTVPSGRGDERGEMRGETTDDQSSEDSDSADELDPGVDIESAAEDIESERSDESDPDHSSETDDIADELDTGVDLESAAETGDDDLESAGGTSESDSTTPADETDPGVDIESAASTESDSAGADPRPETELDPAVGDHAATGTDPRPETELDAERDDESATATDQPSGTDVVPDTDLESAVDTDQEADSEIDPDTIAGRTSAPETGEEAAAREVLSEPTTVTTRETESTAEESSPADTETDHDSREDRPTESPLSAVLATQRATMTSGQELLKGGLTVQQLAARSAVEAPLRGQRQGVELTQAATRRYFDTLASMMNVDASGSEDELQSIYDDGRQSMDEAVAELEAAHGQQRNTDLDEELEAHLEQLQTLQAQIDEQIEPGSERAAALIERQIELLEVCKQRLNADPE